MADVQQQFEQFHDAIRVDFDFSQPLRDKKDIVVNRIRAYLKANSLPTVYELLQGSYAMKTGVKPILELEFDIDIGLRIPILETEHTAATVRSWIFDAVKDHTKLIENKGPCIRVVYEAGYHLDLVTYATWGEGDSQQFRLAHKTNGWRPANPPELLAIVGAYRTNYFADTDDWRSSTDLFRRTVRYLKRWGDVRIPIESDGKPSGLAYTLIAIQSALMPVRSWDGTPSDLLTLLSLVERLAAQPGRISAIKPTPEHEDAFARLTDVDMTSLKDDLAQLRDALIFARDSVDAVAACKRLRDEFGSDFPVPDPSGSAKRSSAPAIVPASRSA